MPLVSAAGYQTCTMSSRTPPVGEVGSMRVGSPGAVAPRLPARARWALPGLWSGRPSCPVWPMRRRPARGRTWTAAKRPPRPPRTVCACLESISSGTGTGPQDQGPFQRARPTQCRATVLPRLSGPCPHHRGSGTGPEPGHEADHRVQRRVITAGVITLSAARCGLWRDPRGVRTDAAVPPRLHRRARTSGVRRCRTRRLPQGSGCTRVRRA